MPGGGRAKDALKMLTCKHKLKLQRILRHIGGFGWGFGGFGFFLLLLFACLLFVCFWGFGVGFLLK